MRKLKKVLGIILVCSLVLGLGTVTYAKEQEECIDGSYLTMEDESFGESLGITRGVYYQSGFSYIGKAGEGKITAGGTTDANMTCTVAINVIVERLVNGNWCRYTSWFASKTGTMITSSKTLTVPRGYYYRVACDHYAGPDSSGSYTNGIYIP